MKQTVLICMFISLVGFAFAPTKTDQFKEVWISNEEVSDHTAGFGRLLDNLRFTDPNAGTLSLSDLKTGVEAQIVTVAKSGADYESVGLAVASITDSSAAKPYVVLVYPGVYNEKVNIEKGYISVVGIDREQCIISHETTDRNQTVYLVASGGPISNVNIANLTIKNTNVFGGGGMTAQAAITVGHADAAGTACTNIRIENCYLYGYQDTTFVYPNCEAVFENCYIYGGFDVAASCKATVKYYNCRLKAAHTSAAGIFYLDECTVHAIGNWLESTQASSKAAKLHHNDDVLYFIGNYMGANLEASPIQFVGGVTPTVYVAGSNGYNYNSLITFLQIPTQNIGGDLIVDGGTLQVDANNNWVGINDTTPSYDLDVNGEQRITQGLNVGTATGAGTGDGKFSGDVTVGGNDLIFGAGATLTGEADKIVTGNKWVNAGTTGMLIGGTVDAGHALSAYSMAYVRLNSRGHAIINVDTDNSGTTDYFSVNQNGNVDDDTGCMFKVLNGDSITTGYTSTKSHELLAHDIIRHTVTGDEATLGEFDEGWTTATIAKTVSITTSMNDAGALLRNEADAVMSATYDGTDIIVTEGGTAWAADDIVTIQIVYEK